MNYSDLLLPVLTGFSGAFTTWFFIRKKQAAETDSVELENVEKAITIWRQLAEDFKKEMESLRIANEQFREENKRLSDKVSKLTTEVRKWERKWEERIKGWSEKKKNEIVG